MHTHTHLCTVGHRGENIEGPPPTHAHTHTPHRRALRSQQLPLSNAKYFRNRSLCNDKCGSLQQRLRGTHTYTPHRRALGCRGGAPPGQRRSPPAAVAAASSSSTAPEQSRAAHSRPQPPTAAAPPRSPHRRVARTQLRTRAATMANGGRFMFLAMLSSSFSFVMSMINIFLCALALSNRMDCDAGSLRHSRGSEYMKKILYRHYIIDESCHYIKKINGVTSASTMAMLLSVLMGLLALHVLTSMVMLLAGVIKNDYFRIVASYMYGFVSYVLMGMETTIFFHIGRDIIFLTIMLDKNQAGLVENYEIDALRFGGVCAILIVYKGLTAPVMNLTMIPSMLIYLHRSIEKTGTPQVTREHSIHSLGIINAYDQPKDGGLGNFQQDGTPTVSSGIARFRCESCCAECHVVPVQHQAVPAPSHASRIPPPMPLPAATNVPKSILKCTFKSL
ncbi:unnamed protein product, partial [Iphiclides podalirius]